MTEELQQIELPMEVQALGIDYSEPLFRYTGQRFKAYHPDRYEEAVKWIAANKFSDRTIARFVHADYRTIQQIRLSQTKDIETQREKLKQTFYEGMMLFAERTVELLDCAKKPTESAVPMGIFKDAWLQVAGLPTANIEVNHHFDISAEIQKLHKEAEETIKQVRARVIEPPQLTEGEKPTT